MQDLMRSGKAPELMDRMMQMARRMGNGDVMAGMTRMMKMMGRMGGMIGPGQERRRGIPVARTRCVP